MKALLVTAVIYAPFLRSLKEKRSLRKSLIARLRNKYNVSVIEAGTLDTIKILTLGIAYAGVDHTACEGAIESIRSFLDSGTEGEVTEFLWEIL